MVFLYKENEDDTPVEVYETGEAPPAGTYCCVKCGEPILVPDMAGILPECEECGPTQWMKF